MKRFLIFLFLFPAIATVSFYAVLYILTGAALDSLSGPALVYLVSIGPGLLMGLVDFVAAKLNLIPGVIATTLLGYLASVLSAWVILESGLSAPVLALGAIGAIPAAMCSWLARRASAHSPGTG